MNCPNCGKEILDEDATFCTECGKTLETQTKSSDLVLAAAILTIIAAAFSAGFGYIAIQQYNYLAVIYFPYYYNLQVPPEFLGFLIFGIPSIIASAFAIAGAIFMLKRKFIIVSMLGVILPLVSVVVTYVTIVKNDLLDSMIGFGLDAMLFAEIVIIIFAVVSAILVFKSRDEFA